MLTISPQLLRLGKNIFTKRENVSKMLWINKMFFSSRRSCGEMVSIFTIYPPQRLRHIFTIYPHIFTIYPHIFTIYYPQRLRHIFTIYPQRLISKTLWINSENVFFKSKKLWRNCKNILFAQIVITLIVTTTCIGLLEKHNCNQYLCRAP